ncbi:MAG: hypothetical protein AMXMBFR6_22100 [Betaproteobacteria bacterium]
MARSGVLFTLLTILWCGVCLNAAIAQTYPNKPIRWIVPFAAGGITDLAARMMAPKLSSILGQQVIIENRPGAGGVIGTDLAAKAPADGYTLVVGSNAALAINPTLLHKIPYDPVSDYSPISRIGDIPLVLVVPPSLGINSIQELVAFAKAHPGQLNYASTGNGTASHLAMELLKSTTGISATHVIFKGSPQAITDLLAGRVHVMFDTIAPQVPHIRAGKLIALAVTSTKRITAMPDIPTVAESGFPGFYLVGWMGALAPAGTPISIINRLNDAFIRVLNDPEIRDYFPKHLGMEVFPSSPAQFAAFIKSEIHKWGKLIIDSGAKAD